MLTSEEECSTWNSYDEEGTYWGAILGGCDARGGLYGEESPLCALGVSEGACRGKESPSEGSGV